VGKTKKGNIKKSIIKTLIYVIVLFIIIVSAGVAYTWYLSKDVVNVSNEIVETQVISSTKITRPALDPNSAVGASVQSLSSPVLAGDRVDMVIKTRQYADCSIIVEYNKIPSKDPGLTIKQADDYGTVNWQWSIPEGTPAGKWPVKVTCKYGEKSGYVEGELVVKS